MKIHFTLVLAFVFGFRTSAEVVPPAGAPSSEPAALTASAEMQGWMAKVDAQWQAIFAKEVTAPYQEEVTKLREQYLAALDGNIAKAAVACRDEIYFCEGRVLSSGGWDQKDKCEMAPLW
jgi:hypothetical protein